MKFARGTEARGLRDSRGPTVFDTDVWAAEFVRPLTGTTIGTLVNWSNHPEALGGDNPYISSDFSGGVRARMEAVRGGTSIFFSGIVGGLMTPLGVNNVPGFPSDDHSHARALKIGEIVADAAISALATAPYATSTAITVAHKDFIIPLENQSLVALNQAGLFDRQLEVDAIGQIGVLTEMYAVRLGPAVFITVPGELFPEIANGGYGRESRHDEEHCPEADTGRPYEPVIRDQFAGATYKFLFGLGQDELGYIVPKYDFWAFGFPPGEIYPVPPPPPLPDPDPARPPIYVGVVEREDPCGVSHYEETVSAASTMAPLVACTAAELAGHDPFNTYDTDPEYEACSPENTDDAAGRDRAAPAVRAAMKTLLAALGAALALAATGVGASAHARNSALGARRDVAGGRDRTRRKRCRRCGRAGGDADRGAGRAGRDRARAAALRARGASSARLRGRIARARVPSRGRSRVALAPDRARPRRAARSARPSAMRSSPRCAAMPACARSASAASGSLSSRPSRSATWARRARACATRRCST